jgi:hypothetical protein
MSAATSTVLYDFVRAISMPAGRQPKAEAAKYGVRIVAILTASWVNMALICWAKITLTPRRSIPSMMQTKSKIGKFREPNKS